MHQNVLRDIGKISLGSVIRPNEKFDCQIRHPTASVPIPDFPNSSGTGCIGTVAGLAGVGFRESDTLHDICVLITLRCRHPLLRLGFLLLRNDHGRGWSCRSWIIDLLCVLGGHSPVGAHVRAYERFDVRVGLCLIWTDWIGCSELCLENTRNGGGLSTCRATFLVLTIMDCSKLDFRPGLHFKP
jgi:hypothetical protein